MQNKIVKFMSGFVVICILMSTMPIVSASQMEDSQYGIHAKMTCRLHGFYPEYEGGYLSAIIDELFGPNTNEITIEIWNDGDNLEIVQIPTEEYVKSTLQGWEGSNLLFESYTMQVHADWFRTGEKTQEIIDVYSAPYKFGKIFKPDTGKISDYLKITGIKLLYEIVWPDVGPGHFISGMGITLDTVKAKFIADIGNKQAYMIGPKDKIILKIKTYNKYNPNTAIFSFPYEDIELDSILTSDKGTVKVMELIQGGVTERKSGTLKECLDFLSTTYPYNTYPSLIPLSFSLSDDPKGYWIAIKFFDDNYYIIESLVYLSYETTSGEEISGCRNVIPRLIADNINSGTLNLYGGECPLNNNDFKVVCKGLSASPLSSEVIVGDPNNPRKFMAVVETGIPIPFSEFYVVEVGNKKAEARVIKYDFLKAEQTLEITPPNQDSEGKYDFVVNVSLFDLPLKESDKLEDAVIYTEGNIDMVEVIDSSGSMAWYGGVIHHNAGALTSEWTKIDTFNIDSSVTTFDVLLETQSDDAEQYLRIKSPSGVWYGNGYTPTYYPLDYTHDTYVKFYGADYIAIYQSGSMESGTWEVYASGVSGRPYALAVQVPPIRIDAAKRAAKYLVANMDDQDQVGLVSFAGTASLDKQLTLLDTAQNRTSMDSSIDSLNALGGTALGDGIYAAKQELTSNGHRPNANPVMILFTNGIWNAGSDPIQRASEAKDAGIKIYTIGFGRVDHSMLQEIADITGGDYLYAPSTTELDSLFLSIKASVKGESTTMSASGTVEQDETSEQKAAIDSRISEVSFSVSWGGSDLDLTLIRPDNSVVDPAVAATDPDIKYTSAATYEIYEVKSPVPGEWTMKIFGAEVTGVEQYTATVIATTSLTLHIYTDRTQYLLNEPIKVIATLTEAGKPITDAQVNAVIQRPDDTTNYILLYDDGKHDDGGALDGVYANHYVNTNIYGSYTINLDASGKTSIGKTFTRETRKSVYVSSVSVGKLSVTPTSWDTGIVHTGGDTIGVFTVNSTSTDSETVIVSATDLTDASGNVIESENVFSMPSIFEVPAGESSSFYERIHVPETTNTGYYSGNIILTSTVNSINIPITLTVEPNLPPVADANGPYTGVVGSPITFNGTGSYDPDGTIVSYEWNLDSDGEFDDASGATPSKIWDTPYSGTISLRVTDDNGRTNIDTTTLTVTEAEEDTTPPTIVSVTLDAYTTIPDATIHITVEATDNIGVTSVTADGINLEEAGSIWEGDVTAPSATGDYTLTIRAEDAAGNPAETTVEYTVVNPSGSIGIGVDPRLTSLGAGNTALINLKLVSTENFDDVAYVYLTTEGVYAGYEADLGWFNRTSVEVEVPAGAVVEVPFVVDIPEGEGGYKVFYAKLESTKWTPTAMDTGILYIT